MERFVCLPRVRLRSLQPPPWPSRAVLMLFILLLAELVDAKANSTTVAKEPAARTCDGLTGRLFGECVYGLTAASPQARTSAKDDAVGSLRHVSAEELAQLLRAAITNGARQYNAGEGDGCLDRLWTKSYEESKAAGSEI